MAVKLSECYIFVSQADKCFKVATNYTNYFELGAEGVTDYYVEARIQNDEFLINAIVLDPDTKETCRVVNNFPDSADCRREMICNGYRILGSSGRLLLGIDVHENVCLLRGTIYDRNGVVVAEEAQDDFLVHRGPAVLGKQDQSRGIVIG